MEKTQDSKQIEPLIPIESIVEGYIKMERVFRV
jgi:hypothetical protein